MSDVDSYTIVRLEEEQNRLLERIETLEREKFDLEDALRLILPMAKGYAYEHPVGRNQQMVEDAEAALSSGKPDALTPPQEEQK